MAELSGLEVFALAKEIESSLRGTYVKNVYSLGASQLLRMGRPGGEDLWVVVSPKVGAWVSAKVSGRAETTAMTTRLRQELVRSKFSGARQVGEDRIYDLQYGEGDLARHLFVELMPPGNLVVTDADLKALVVLNEVRSPSRRVLRGMAYSPPPQRRKSPAEATPAELEEASRREATAGAAVGRGFSLPRKYVAEVLSRAGLSESDPSSSLGGREKAVVAAMRALTDEVARSPHPCICDTPRGEEIFALLPQAYRVVRTSGSLSGLCDDLLLGRAAAEREPAPSPSDSRRAELEATIAGLKGEADSRTSEAARIRDLAAEAGRAETTEEVLKVLASAGVGERRVVTSPASAASALFDRAKDLEKKAAEAKKASLDLARKLGRAPQARPRRLHELKRSSQEWYEKYRWFFTSAGRLAIGGRDAQSNSIIVKRHLDPGDTVYHADLFGSPFFVLKGGRQQSEAEEGEVAQATVAFSSAWKTGLGSADAYWVESDQVSATAPSGEYLPKGGFLIRGKKNFMTKNLVEVAVGFDRDRRVISGPESAISRTAVAYVVLRPQMEKGSETAKRVLKDLVSLAGAESGSSTTVDDVMRMLPTGGGKILRKHRVANGTGDPETRNSAP